MSELYGRILILNNSYHESSFIASRIKQNGLIIFKPQDLALKQLASPRVINFPTFYFDRSKHSSRLKYLRMARKTNKWLADLKFDINIIEVIAGSDKELINQLVFSHFKTNKITLIDEGIGFYRKRFFFSKLKNSLYVLISRLLGDLNVEFVQPLGSHTLVTDIYLRRKDLISYKRLDVNYHSIPNYDLDNIVPNNKCCIILPHDSNDKMLERKLLFVLPLLIELIPLKVELKPHPLDVNNYQDILSKYPQVVLLNSKLSAESLKLYNYRLVISFRSSSILDLVFNKRSENVITISLDKNHVKDNIYPRIVYFRDTYEIEKNITNVLNPSHE